MKRLKYLLLIMLLIPITVNATLNKITIEPDEIKIPGMAYSNFTMNNYIQTQNNPNYFYKLDENGNIINKVILGEKEYADEVVGLKNNKYQSFTIVTNQEEYYIKLYDEDNKLIAQKTFSDVSYIYDTNYNNGYFCIKISDKNGDKHYYVLDEKLNIVKDIIINGNIEYLSLLSLNENYLVLYKWNRIISFNLHNDEVYDSTIEFKEGDRNIYSAEAASDILLVRDGNKLKVLNNKIEEIKTIKIPNDFNFNNLIKTDNNEYILIYLNKNISNDFRIKSYEEFKKSIITIKYDKNFNEISRPSIEDVLDKIPIFDYFKEYYNINTLKEFYNVKSKLPNTYYRRFGKKLTRDQADFDSIIYKNEILIIHGLENEREETFGDLYITQASLDLKEIKTQLLMTVTPNEAHHLVKFIPGEKEIKIAIEDFDENNYDDYIRIKTIKIDTNEYNITSMPNNNGYIEHPDKASPGKEVTFKPIPNEGYVLSGLYLIDELGNKEHIKGNTFIMPEHNVTIEAIYTLENPNTSTINFISMLILIPIIPITMYLINKYSQNKIYN